MLDDPPSVLILGIGNLLWADEGFGTRTVEALHRSHTFADNVRLMDGGTLGLYLIQHVQQADVLLVFDAVDYGLEPGTLHCVVGADVPRFMGAKKMSLHQTGFQEVLMTTELLGSMPRHLALVGVQPHTLEDFGGSLTPPVRSQVKPAIAAGLRWLEGLGVAATRRDIPLGDDERLSPPALELTPYERGRPGPEAAPRQGDPRVLSDPAVRFDPKPLPDAWQHLSVNVDNRRPL